MKLMWRYTMKYKGLVFLNFLSVFGFILIELGLPTLLAKMIDNGIAVNDFGEVKYYGLIMIAICLIGLVALMFLAYCGSKIT
ncbi:MAG: ABC transporter ATP-binding protein, partial [Carnobacterium sp.]|nr:ABC transporter ATP-binding protein [Carnobacterium sp.]